MTDETKTKIQDLKVANGRTIRHFRELAGLSQKDFAHALGYAKPGSEKIISNMERGVTSFPSKYFLPESILWGILKCTPDEFAFDRDERPNFLDGTVDLRGMFADLAKSPIPITESDFPKYARRYIAVQKALNAYNEFISVKDKCFQHSS